MLTVKNYWLKFTAQGEGPLADGIARPINCMHYDDPRCGF